MKIRKLLVNEPQHVILLEGEFDNTNLKQNEIIVKTLYSHISAGTELACLAGTEDWFPIPGTPGYTTIAQVVEKGTGITHVNVGDLVYTYGSHSEYFRLEYGDRWHGMCVKLPNGINPEFASFTHMASIALTAIRKSDIELGDFVLVTGLGAIGNLASQLAQLQGAIVIATDIDEHRIDLACKSGIRYVVNSKKENLQDKISEITKGALVNTYIDASGNSLVINESLAHVRLYGEAILLGSPRAAYDTDLTKTLQYFHLLPHCLTLNGALEFSYPTHENEFVKHSIERNASIVLNLINEGRLNIAPIYTHKLSPREAQKAYDGLKNKPDEFIGVVFDWKN
jgi:2-desacetyl-2-hydroxyethyl bacteriochlorophyllide A dehydrogenase